MGDDKLAFRFAGDERGVVLQFPPRKRDVIEIVKVRLLDHDPATGMGYAEYAMDDDTAPSEVNPSDPFVNESDK